MKISPKIATVAAITMALASPISYTLAASDPGVLDNIKETLRVDGAHDEGCDDHRNNLKTGSVHCFLTHPSTIEINEVQGGGQASRGTLRYHFDCRKRVKDFKLGGETGTKDHQRPGVVSADYVFFGDLALSKVVRTGEGRCGRVIESKLQSR